jgi:hypothetical protein
MIMVFYIVKLIFFFFFRIVSVIGGCLSELFLFYFGVKCFLSKNSSIRFFFISFLSSSDNFIDFFKLISLICFFLILVSSFLFLLIFFFKRNSFTFMYFDWKNKIKDKKIYVTELRNLRKSVWQGPDLNRYLTQIQDLKGLKWYEERHYLFFSSVGAYKIFSKSYFKPFKNKPFFERDDYHEKAFGDGANIFWAFGLKKNFRKGFFYFHKRVLADIQTTKIDENPDKNKSGAKPKIFNNFPKISFLLVQDFMNDDLILEEKIFYFSFLDFYSFLYGNSIFLPLQLKGCGENFNKFNNDIAFFSDSGFLESSLFEIAYSDIFLYRIEKFFKRKDQELLYTYEYWRYDLLKYPRLFQIFLDTDLETHQFLKPNFLRLRWFEIAEQLPPYDYSRELTQSFLKSEIYDKIYDPWFIFKNFSFLNKKNFNYSDLKIKSFFRIKHSVVPITDIRLDKVRKLIHKSFRKYQRSRYIPLFLIFKSFYFLQKFKKQFKKKNVLKRLKKRYLLFYLSNGIFVHQSKIFRKTSRFRKKDFKIRFKFNVYKRDHADRRNDYFRDLVKFEQRFNEEIMACVPEWHRIEFIVESFDKFFIYPDARFIFKRKVDTIRVSKPLFNSLLISDFLYSPFSHESWLLKLASRSSGHIREANIFFDLYSRIFSIMSTNFASDFIEQDLVSRSNLRPISFYDGKVNILKKLRIDERRIYQKLLVNVANGIFSMYTRNRNTSFFISKNLINKNYLLPNFFFYKFLIKSVFFPNFLKPMKESLYPLYSKFVIWNARYNRYSLKTFIYKKEEESFVMNRRLLNFSSTFKKDFDLLKFKFLPPLGRRKYLRRSSINEVRLVMDTWNVKIYPLY